MLVRSLSFFNERLRELCAKPRFCNAKYAAGVLTPSLRVLCVSRREHFIKKPGLSPYYPLLIQMLHLNLSSA